MSLDELTEESQYGRFPFDLYMLVRLELQFGRLN